MEQMASSPIILYIKFSVFSCYCDINLIAKLRLEAKRLTFKTEYLYNISNTTAPTCICGSKLVRLIVKHLALNVIQKDYVLYILYPNNQVIIFLGTVIHGYSQIVMFEYYMR